MKIKTIIFLAVIFSVNIFSQQTKTIVPGKHYEAGWLHELFFGAHWRDLWTTPVKVDVVDLNTYGGGLTPLKRGGGLQTLSLRFKGGDGKEYKFRSLDKDPKKVLPKDLQESIGAVIVQDQISSSNPYAGFVVNEILKGAGVYHSEYQLVVLPNDDKLGEFKKVFGGLLGIMEIVPQEEMFEGADKIISTVKLFDRLNKEFDEEVDAKEYLKARLMDIFFGDWDRHKDQWKWIRFEEDKKKIYKPFPLDRDQAFAEFDGLLPKIGEGVIPQFNHFGENYPDMRYMTWSGRYLDQRFLTLLYKVEWDKVTNEVYSKLTNELIDRAVKKLPPEVYNQAKDELTEKLRSRRNQFKEASNEYYQLVNSVVDIYTTDKDDFVIIRQMPRLEMGRLNPALMIEVYKRNTSKGIDKESFIKHRYYNEGFVPSELRIYLQDGDDKVVMELMSIDIPTIRIIGGDGKDEIENNSNETILFYDDGKKSYVKGDVFWDKDKYQLPYEMLLKEYDKKKKNMTDDEKDKFKEQIANLRYDPILPPDKFGMYTSFPIINYSPDIGSFFGGTYSYYKYGFRMNPYLYKFSFTAGYAPQKKGILGLLVDVNTELNGIVKNSKLVFHGRKSGIEFNNFFGLGNNTSFNDSLFKADFYKIEHEEYLFSPSIEFPRNSKLFFTLGSTIRSYDVKNSFEGPVFGSISNFNLLSFDVGFTFDCRDNKIAPYKGYFINLLYSYNPHLFKNSNVKIEFAKIICDVRGYLGYKDYVSLALRLWGEKLSGDVYPFSESVFLGGSKTLRGFPSERFAGDGSVMGSAEVRFKLFKMNFLFPETVGLFGFAESGRVFLKVEDSKTWHSSFGGGLFMHVINRDITLNFTFAHSKERKLVFIFGNGFAF